MYDFIYMKSPQSANPQRQKVDEWLAQLEVGAWGDWRLIAKVSAFLWGAPDILKLIVIAA